MSDFPNLLSCNIGGANFTLTEYSYKETPVVREGFGRIGTRVSIEGTGYVSAAGFAALAAAIQAADGSLHTSGQNLTITGVGGVVEQTLAAAACVDGGPHIDFSIGTGDIGMQRDVKFTATGSTAPDGPINTYTMKVATRPDGLIVVTQSGEIYGPDTLAYFTSTTLPQFQQQYQVPDWVVKFDRAVTSDIYLTRTAYSMEAVQTQAPLPFYNGVQAVQGSASISTARDAQDRLTTTYDFDLLLGATADPDAFVAGLRAWVIGNCPQTTAGSLAQIYSESYRIADITENRVQANFQVVTGADSNDLVSWQQSFEGQYSDGDGYGSPGDGPPNAAGPTFIGPPLIALTYPGVAPILIADHPPVYRYTQRGTAIGVSSWPQPPAPLYAQNLEAIPKPKFSWTDNEMRQTDWSYEFVFTTSLDSTQPPLSSLGRPASPQFFGGPAQPGGGGGNGGVELPIVFKGPT